MLTRVACAMLACAFLAGVSAAATPKLPHAAVTARFDLDDNMGQQLTLPLNSVVVLERSLPLIATKVDVNFYPCDFVPQAIGHEVANPPVARPGRVVVGAYQLDRAGCAMFDIEHSPASGGSYLHQLMIKVQ